MKVLHVIPRLGWGGPERQLAWLAPALQTRGVAVRIATFAGGGPLAEELGRSGLPVDVLGRSGHDLRGLARLARLVRSFQPDIVHTWRAAGHRLGRLLAGAVARTRLVGTGDLPPAGRSPGGRLLDRWLHRRTAAWIVPHPALARHWVEEGLPPDRVRAILPAAAPMATEGPDLRAELAIPPTALAVLDPLRLERSKGGKDALWALDILHYLHEDTYLLMAGGGAERPGLEEFVRNLRLKDRVRFLGWRGDLSDLLRAADVIWLPAHRDDVTHAAVEAAAAGRPVVASRLATLEGVVIPEETGLFVPPGDKPELARQTLRLLRDPGLRRRMGESARRRAEAAFSPDRLASDHVALYEEVLARR